MADAFIRDTFTKDASCYDAYTKKSYSIVKERRAWQKLYAECLTGEGSRVLNVGCGPGTEAMALADAGYDVTALDFSPKMIELTQRNAAENGLTITTVIGDAEDLPFDDGSFDFVVSNYAMWAIPHPETALKEMHRVLRDGGILSFIDCGKTHRKPNFIRRAWRHLAFRMREKDDNGHTGVELTDEERDHLDALWSVSAVRPERDLENTRMAGFEEVSVIDHVDRRIFKGRRYIEYGYHEIHFMILARK